MPEKDDTLAAIVSGLLPGVRLCTPGGLPYDPRCCLAIYCPAEECETLQMAAVLAGESAAGRGGQCCSLMEGIPHIPPPGAILIGTWKALAAVAPHLLESLSQPATGGYIIRLDRHVLMTGNDCQSVLAAAQTFVQMLALSPTRSIPGCLIADQPAIRRRSFLLDLSSAQPRITSLTRIIGLLQSFKADRLHLFFNAVSPRRRRSAIGVASCEDAETIASYSREYHLQVVPWADLAVLVANEELSPGAAWEIGRQMVDAFGAAAIGLATAQIAPSAMEGVRELVARLVASQTPPFDIYLPLAAAAACADLQQPGFRVIACRFAEDDVSLSPPSAALALPTAVFGVLGVRDFEPVSPDAACQQLNRILSAAISDGAEEVGYFCPTAGGKIWVNELSFLIAYVAAAWEGRAATDATRRRFLRLAYGEEGAAVDEVWRVIAEAFPAELRGDNSAEIRQAVFGKKIGPAAWQRLLAIEWASHEQRLRAAEETLLQCRKRLTRNAETLSAADIPLSAARCLARQAYFLKEALAHYQAAQEGRAGSLARARQCLERLFFALTPFFQRLRAFTEDSGYASAEAKSLEQWFTRLRDQMGMLSRLETAEKLPAPDEIGLPPLSK